MPRPKNNLQRQLKDLERLLKIKEDTIAALQAQLLLLQLSRVTTIPHVTQIKCIDRGELCQYPFPWHGVTPPPCNKCGQLNTAPWITITSNGVTLNNN